MGFNVLGIAASIKTDKITDITNLLKIEVSKDFEIRSFDEAISVSIDDDEIFFTPTLSGVILTVGDNVPILDTPVKKLSQNGKSLKFVVGETGMAFALEYSENGKIIRTMRTSDADGNLIKQGKTLDIEYSGAEDMTDLIFGLTGEVCGERIDTIEPDVKSYSYRFIKKMEDPIQVPNTEIIKTDISKLRSKPWWKFW